MANSDSVSQNTQDYFGSYRIAFAPGQSLANTGNAVITLPILSGGIGPSFGNGSYIVRRITVSNPSNTAGGTVPSMTAANITILTSNDGNTSNAITTAVGQTLGNISGTATFQDLVLVNGNANVTTLCTAGPTYNSPALFVKVGAAVANAAVNITVWGDVVQL
jgi:hypothetical protein